MSVSYSLPQKFQTTSPTVIGQKKIGDTSMKLSQIVKGSKGNIF